MLQALLLLFSLIRFSENLEIGVCPAPPEINAEYCARATFVPGCNDDGDCLIDYKCCPTGECHIPNCVKPVKGDQPGCPEDDRICKQRVDTCSGHQDCGYNEVCCFNPSCGYFCKMKVIPAEFEKPEKRRKECPDSLCQPDTIDNCFVNPCDFNTCPNYPDAICCDDFCDCSPRYYDSQGSEVTAMCLFGNVNYLFVRCQR